MRVAGLKPGVRNPHFALVGFALAVCAVLLYLRPVPPILNQLGSMAPEKTQERDWRELIHFIDAGPDDLTEQQKTFLESTRSEPSTIGISVTKFPVPLLRRPATAIILPLNERKLELRDYALRPVARDRQRLTWSSEDEKIDVSLLVGETTISGMIYDNDNVYSLAPLGQDKQGTWLEAIIQVDQTKFPGRRPSE